MKDEWLDSNAVAQMLALSRGHFMERVATRKDFPAPSMALGRPRWRRSEVDDWMEAHKISRAA